MGTEGNTNVMRQEIYN